jgi:competence protein ComEC
LKNRVLRTFLSWIFFFFIGVWIVFLTNSQNHKNYFEKFVSKKNTLVFVIDKVLKSGKYQDKYIVEVVQVDSYKTRGKVILNIKKDTLVSNFEVGNKLVSRTSFLDVKSALNPHQFDYKNYLFKQDVFKQVFRENKQINKLLENHFSLHRIAFLFRNKIQKKLQKYHFTKDELGVINALLLGQRNDLSTELKNDYIRAGAIHVLAVSGLHVGIVLLLLSFFLKPLERLKKGKIVKAIVLILFLWGFAFIAGLSASVVRAVTMFTAVAIGQSFQRKSIVEHSLIISMFVLLICKPMFLFDVGFQLSYLAVFGIVWLQPEIYKRWTPKWKFIDYFWKLGSVSMAAQVGVLPISLYYFHQFPGLFMLSNFVIIPFLSAILMGGFFLIILALLELLPDVFVTFYGTIISLMNQFIHWVSEQEEFLLSEISVSFYLLLGLYLFIIFLFQYFRKQSLKKLLYVGFSIIVIQLIFIGEEYQKTQKKVLVVFHQNRKSIIGKRIQDKLIVNENAKDSNAILSYRIGEEVDVELQRLTPAIFKIGNKTVLIIDSLGVYKVPKLLHPIVVLQHSPKINIERLILKLQPEHIIADGSNYKSDINNWRAICLKRKTPFHATGENGAYIVE